MPKRSSKSSGSTSLTSSECRAHQACLPEEIKAMFGSLGFVKWTNCQFPVLITDPMQMVLDGILPEGMYRAWWFRIITRTASVQQATAATRRKALEQVPLLVYWYGTSFEISMVRLRDILTWEEGVQRGLDKYPKFMETRDRWDHPILVVYSLLKNALEQVKRNAVSLAPEERSLRFFPANSANNNIVLNEWHALALEQPPHVHTWRKQKATIEAELFTYSSLYQLGEIAYLPKTCGRHNYHHPVLILSPFRVPPQLRNEWFTKCSDGELVMVYWLGHYTCASDDAPDTAYSFHKPEELRNVGLPPEKIPDSILRCYKKGPSLKPKKLAMDVDLWVCGVNWELPLALERHPNDRWGGLEDFEENYEDDFEFYWKLLDGSRDDRKARSTTETVTSRKGSNKNESREHKVDPLPLGETKESVVSTKVPGRRKVHALQAATHEASTKRAKYEVEIPPPSTEPAPKEITGNFIFGKSSVRGIVDALLAKRKAEIAMAAHAHTDPAQRETPETVTNLTKHMTKPAMSPEPAPPNANANVVSTEGSVPGYVDALPLATKGASTILTNRATEIATSPPLHTQPTPPKANVEISTTVAKRHADMTISSPTAAERIKALQRLKRELDSKAKEAMENVTIPTTTAQTPL
jgi:hypothetical protein